MTLPTRRFVEVVCDNPRHENWDDHEWQTDDCIVQVTEPLMSRAEWEATIDYEVEAVEVPSYEYFDGARAQVGVLYEVRATVLYPGRYGIVAVGEETP